MAFFDGEPLKAGLLLRGSTASAKIYNFEQFPFFIFSPGVLKIEILASLNSQ